MIEVQVPTGAPRFAQEIARNVRDVVRDIRQEQSAMRGMMESAGSAKAAYERASAEIPEVNERGYRQTRQELSANTTLDPSAMRRVHYVTFSATPRRISLPPPGHGYWVILCNYGANSFTVRDDLGNTICTLAQYDMALIRAYNTSTGTPLWPTKVETWRSDGTLTLGVPLGITSGGTGLSALGTANQLFGMNAGATAGEWKTLSGTTNQITVTHGVGTITLATPQNIHTGATPTFSNLTLSARTSTRVAYFGASGVFTDSANMTFDGSKLSLAATGSSGGVLVGGDAQLYRSAANQWYSPDYFQVTGPNFTSTSAQQANIQSTCNFAPSGNTSGRFWTLYFSATASTNNNFTDSTSGIVGMEGAVTHSGSGTITQASCVLVFSQASSTGTITTMNGVYVLGFDGSTGATITTYNGIRSDGPRLSGAGAVTTAYCFVCHPRTVSTGTITTMVGAGIFPNGNMNAHNANNQVRIGIDIGAMPNPGAFTGTTTYAIRINGTGGARDGVLFSDVNIYRSAANILTCDGGVLSIHATKGVGYGTGAGGTVTQATSKATGVTLNKVCGQITMNNAALAAATSVSFTLTNSAIAATDVVVVNIATTATANSYAITVDAVAAGSCRIQLRNISAGSLSEALVLNFAVIKGVTS